MGRVASGQDGGGRAHRVEVAAIRHEAAERDDVLGGELSVLHAEVHLTQLRPVNDPAVGGDVGAPTHHDTVRRAQLQVGAAGHLLRHGAGRDEQQRGRKESPGGTKPALAAPTLNRPARLAAAHPHKPPSLQIHVDGSEPDRTGRWFLFYGWIVPGAIL